MPVGSKVAAVTTGGSWLDAGQRSTAFGARGSLLKSSLDVEGERLRSLARDTATEIERVPVAFLTWLSTNVGKWRLASSGHGKATKAADSSDKHAAGGSSR